MGWICNQSMKVDLSKFNNSWYYPGKNFLIRVLWHFTNALFFKNPLNPFSKLKINLLRFFGAKIGRGVVIKPSINIKYPWNLEVGNHTWLGEHGWFDSLTSIKIGNNVCISQGAYLCTGNHNYKKESFDLIVKPIIIEDGAWLGAKSIVCPGVVIRTHAVLEAGSVATHDLEPYMVYAGNPAKPKRKRFIDQ